MNSCIHNPLTIVGIFAPAPDTIVRSHRYGIGCQQKNRSNPFENQLAACPDVPPPKKKGGAPVTVPNGLEFVLIDHRHRVNHLATKDRPRESA